MAGQLASVEPTLGKFPLFFDASAGPTDAPNETSRVTEVKMTSAAKGCSLLPKM